MQVPRVAHAPVADGRCRQGDGTLNVNGKSVDSYFSSMQRRLDVLSPLSTTGTLGQFNVYATVKGGGTTGQAQVHSARGLLHVLPSLEYNIEPRPAKLHTRPACDYRLHGS